MKLLKCMPYRGYGAMRSISACLLAACIALLLAVPSAWAQDETFGMVTDTHIGAHKSCKTLTLKAMKYVKKQKNVVGFINCGDVTNVGGKREYQAYLDLLKKSGLKVPHIQAIGNHDNAAGAYQKWLHHAGYKGYNKNTGVNLFKKMLNGGKLNTVTRFKHVDVITLGQGEKQKGGVLTNAMVKWLDKQLKKTHRSGKMALVVFHYAPWQSTDEGWIHTPKNMNRVLGVCESYPNVIIACGHEHVYDNAQKCMKYHYPYAKANKFKRTGIKASKARYPVRLMCLASLSRVKGVFGKVKSERHAHVSLLTFRDDGSVKLVDRDLTKKKDVFTSTFKQAKASVVVSAKAPKDKASQGIAFKVKFSDGKSYGGVSSGETFTVDAGSSKALDDIPSGVLVTVTPKTTVKGCAKPNKQVVEVTKKKQKLTFSYS